MPADERVRRLERLQTAFRTYDRLRARGRARLRDVEQYLMPRRAAREPPWLHFLDEQQRAELEAARPGAEQFTQQGLAKPRRGNKYQAGPDPTGERARELQRLSGAYEAYLRLKASGIARQKDAERDQAQRPESTPGAEGDKTTQRKGNDRLLTLPYQEYK